MKQCAICGKEIPRRKFEPSAQYKRRKTCGPECATAFVKQRNAEVGASRTLAMRKTCRACGAEFERAPGESSTVFRSRQYCSAQCKSMRFQVNRRCQQCGKTYVMSAVTSGYNCGSFCSKQCHDASEAPDDVTRCECGAEATLHPWVVQIDGDGEYFQQQIHVCGACAAELTNAAHAPVQLPAHHEVRRNEPTYHAPARFAWRYW